MNIESLKDYTPLFRTLHEERYLRRDFLKKIKEIFRVNCVLSYISPVAPIDQTDPIVFEDLLYGIKERKVNSILLILHSLGGSPDVAEKIVETIRERTRKFYVVIPERAKSSATLLSLGSDKIYMLESAELGPIDPQVKIKTPSGEQWRPAQSIIDGYFAAIQIVASKGKELGIAAPLLLQMIDLPTLDFANKALQHAKAIAEKLLTTYMLKNSEKAKKVAKKLADANEFLSHGRPIRWHYAKNELGLNVSLIKRNTEKYELIWRYFLYAIKFLLEKKLNKLFENDSGVSLIF